MEERLGEVTVPRGSSACSIPAPAAVEELRRRRLAIAALAFGWDAIEATLAELGED
jgi:hypothetical protein